MATEEVTEVIFASKIEDLVFRACSLLEESKRVEVTHIKDP